MARNENKALKPDIIAADREALLALKQREGYAPANQSIRPEALSAIETRLSEAEEGVVHATQALKVASNLRTARAWELHNAMLLAKAAVTSQYGPNSDAIESLGLKKKSNYRRPSRRRSNDQ